jgi:nitric-oxide synthase
LVASRLSRPDADVIGITEAVSFAAAEDFLRLFYSETDPPAAYEKRLREVRIEIDENGTYQHTSDELRFGARVAWRNSARCIGRLYWKSLSIRDRRTVSDPADVAAECVSHLYESTRNGRIRSTITICAPERPGCPGPRIINEQLIRYAGHQLPDGEILGDPQSLAITRKALALGWHPPEPIGRFDVLPLVIIGGDGRSQLYDIPRGAVLEVPIVHPEYEWFAGLGLRWHAVPAISNMPLASAASATRPHRSTATTSAPRSVPAISPTHAGTT